MKYAVIDMNVQLFPDDTRREDGCSEAVFDCARGSYACFQLMLTEAPYGQISCTWQGALPGEASVRRLVKVYVAKNTGEAGFTAGPDEDVSANTIRKAPFWVYDPMVELRGKHAAYTGEDANVGLYVMVRIPEKSDVRDWQAALTVRVGEEACTVPVTLRVCAARIPAASSFGLIQWFSFTNMARYHDVELWSEAHWDIIRRYCELMRHGRQNYFWINKEIVDCKRVENGFQFDFSRAERFIAMAFAMGFTRLESGMVIERRWYEDSTFIIRAGDEELTALSDDGYRYLHDYFTQLREMLCRNGWLDKVVQHVADEPHPGCVQEYRVLSGIVRMLMPGVPLIDAVETWDLFGSDDILVPKNFYYEAHREQFERYRSMGNDLWVYTCCHPGGRFMNRALDMPLLRVRLMHWAIERYRLSGYLHWGLNYYDYTDDPFAGKAGQAVNLGDVELPPGDTHIVYPDTDGPMSSVRFEAMRAGQEDAELLLMLRERDAAAEQAILDGMVRGFGDFREDIPGFREAHAALLEKASAL